LSRIESADVFVAHHRLSKPRVYAIATNLARESVLVRLRDTDGIVGWGETYVRPGVDRAALRAAQSIIGRDPSRRREAARLIRDAAASSWAEGAVAMAVDDLAARQLGLSVAELYGGPVRTEVRAYAAGSGYMSDRTPEQSWLAEVELLVAAGFTAVKLRIGRFDVDNELAGLAVVRSSFPGLELMADANAAYTLPQSLRVGAAMADLGFTFLEEPMPQTAYAAYERLTPISPIPIAGGELLESRSSAREAVTRGAFDIVQPDPSICGGPSEVRFIAELAALDGVRCIPHTCNGAIALAATLQLVAVMPNPTLSPSTEAPLLECDTGENPLRTDLLTRPLTFRQGFFVLPSAPGLGVDVDEQVLNRYAEKVA
jgi:D-galactarolactone cycloisomerase